MQTRPLALDRSPTEVLASLACEPGAFALEVPDPTAPVILLGCAPVAELRVGTNDDDPLGAIARFIADAPVADTALPFPFAGGVIACLAYELGTRIVPGVSETAAGPLAVLRRYDPLLIFDRRQARYSLVGTGGPAPAWLERLAAPAPVWAGALAAQDLRATFDRETYRRAVARILAYLEAGDAYQVNLTQPFTVPLLGPAWALHTRLAAPHGAYVDLGDAQVVCASPELFLRRRGTHVETRPIKGTRPRGADPAHDAALAAELRADPKERAEHVMIVDLERNDLGRVAEHGSVRVTGHARVESHPTVHHLVSTVTASLRPDVGWRELLEA